MARTKSKTQDDIEWHVHLKRKRQTYVGRVFAPTEKGALAKAIEELKIPENILDEIMVKRAS
jgi:hypothetical protein